MGTWHHPDIQPQERNRKRNSAARMPIPMDCSEFWVRMGALIMKPVRWPKSLWWRLLKVILVTGPPVGLSLWAYFGFRNYTGGPLSGLVATHPGWFLGLFLTPIAANLIGEIWEHIALHHGDADDINQVEFSVLLTTIDRIVAEKSERFGGVLQTLNGQKVAAGDLFRRITEPDRQIKSLLLGMHLSFSDILKETEFRIVLVSVSNGIPDHFIHAIPGDALPSDDFLREGTVKKTFFFEVCRKKEPLAIPDIKKNLNKKKGRLLFYCTKGGEVEGSIIGIPIRHPFLDRITHVITIHSRKPGTFDYRFPKRYRRAIRCFVNRICLEHTLELLRDHASIETNRTTADRRRTQIPGTR